MKKYFLIGFLKSYKIMKAALLLQLLFGSFCAVYYAIILVESDLKSTTLQSVLLPFAQSLVQDESQISNSYFFLVFNAIFICLGLIGLVAYAYQNALLVAFHAILTCFFGFCSMIIYILMVVDQRSSQLLFLSSLLYGITIGSYGLILLDKILLQQTDSCEIPITVNLLQEEI